jgi:beta-lactam-binding protein with PASTA domain
VVTPTAAGSYANDVSVSTSLADPNPFNDHATATLAVTGPAPTETCVVPNLRGAASRLAGVVLRDLGCEVKTTHAHSKTVHKGNVIKTSPGAGAHPFGTAVTLQISSGRSKKKHKKHPTRHPARV